MMSRIAHEKCAKEATAKACAHCEHPKDETAGADAGGI